MNRKLSRDLESYPEIQHVNPGIQHANFEIFAVVEKKGGIYFVVWKNITNFAAIMSE